jgi:NAD(P)-dependent dehydrogenase (short-subunit alcohol dehydrogenase family)
MGVELEKNVGARVSKALLRRLDWHMSFHHRRRSPVAEKTPGDMRKAEFLRDRLNAWARRSSPFVAYGRSKTANILFAVEFDRRHRDRGVRATAVHPGGIATELARHMPDGAMQAWVQQIQEQRAAAGEAPFEFKSIPQGAATSVWAGVVASAEEVGGKYCEDCHVGELIAADSRG